MCDLDLPSMEGICGKKPPWEPISETHRIPIAALDKAVCFPFRDWEQYQNYVHILEIMVRWGVH